MEKSNTITVASDGNLPVVIGDCPSCGSGDRSMILIDYVPNLKNSIDSTVYLKCICCNTIHQRKVKDLVMEE